MFGVYIDDEGIYEYLVSIHETEAEAIADRDRRKAEWGKAADAYRVAKGFGMAPGCAGWDVWPVSETDLESPELFDLLEEGYAVEIDKPVFNREEEGEKVLRVKGLARGHLYAVFGEVANDSSPILGLYGSDEAARSALVDFGF